MINPIQTKLTRTFYVVDKNNLAEISEVLQPVLKVLGKEILLVNQDNPNGLMRGFYLNEGDPLNSSSRHFVFIGDVFVLTEGDTEDILELELMKKVSAERKLGKILSQNVAS